MTAARWSLASSLALLALAMPAITEAHRPAPPRCPLVRPQAGAHCSVPRQSCPYPCSAESHRAWRCTCTRDADGHLAWGCDEGPLCGE